MSYLRSKYVDDSLMEDVFNKLNRLNKYGSRQDLLDEIRDLNLELEREKKMQESYRHRYEAKTSESHNLTKNLDSVRDYQSTLMKEHKQLEDRYLQLKKQNDSQKGDLEVLRKEVDAKEVDYFLNRRRCLDVVKDERWLREMELERRTGSKYRYWHWRPWLYSNHREIYDKYYPYTSYDPSWYYPYYSSSYPYYSRYFYNRYPYSTWSRKLALDDRMEHIQKMTDDLKLSNHRMLDDLKSVKSKYDY